jgi:hypothetical protein
MLVYGDSAATQILTLAVSILTFLLRAGIVRMINPELCTPVQILVSRINR